MLLLEFLKNLIFADKCKSDTAVVVPGVNANFESTQEIIQVNRKNEKPKTFSEMMDIRLPIENQSTLAEICEFSQATSDLCIQKNLATFNPDLCKINK